MGTVRSLAVRSLAVLSPHLDDAALSVGATVRAAVRAGASARVVTVFAGDPASALPAGPWDRGSGFSTHGAASTRRREEDRAACRTMGAEPVWLPFPDEQYGPRPAHEEIRAALVDAVGGADVVLVPGWPLLHPDHEALAAAALTRPHPWPRVAAYVEQPYALGRGRPTEAALVRAAGRSFGPAAFAAWPTRVDDRWRRRKARRAYRSQQDQLGAYVRGTFRDLERKIARFERRQGAELLWELGEGGS